MKTIYVALLFLFQGSLLGAQTMNAVPNQKPDERYKADILVVVAHPDDETAIFSYLAKAVLDEGKRVAVVYTNRGDGGGNEIGGERSTSLGMIREIEARRGLASFGIYNVWFLDGRDTTSQNVLLSLSNWQHSRVLEQAIRVVRLTRPEVVLTWMPALVGDHGDHQAAGVIATEAFDSAGDRTVFPAQIASRRRKFEPLLEGLRPWQAKKLYYFTDSLWLDLKGKALEYSSQDISLSRKVSYERLAAEEASFHLSQEDNKLFADALAKGELEKYLRDAKTTLGFAVFPNPVRLMPAKSHVKTSASGDIFEGISKDALSFVRPRGFKAVKRNGVSVELGSAWTFYPDFWQAHDLDVVAQIIEPRIYITAGNTLQVPLLLRNDTNESQEVNLNLKTKLPDGWNETPHPSRFVIEAGDVYSVQISITTPARPSADWRQIKYAVEVKGREVSTTILKVQLRASTIPQ
jgi:LmbE family N-acetylglucosaminyl deacetylase